MTTGPAGQKTESVQKELERILAAGVFAQSERLRELLTYLVRASIEGRTSGLKEVVIAREVFGRDDYDPKENSLIRMTAANLRTKLDEYYAGPGAADPVRVSVPKGSFVPVFTERTAPAAPHRIRYSWALGIAGVLAVLILIGWLRNRAAPPPILSSIAVLPFLDLTADHSMAYFCDGLTEELIDSLAKQKDLAVVASTSSFEFKNKPYGVQSIGRQLAVDSVMEGSVRRSADQLRVTVQLNSTQSGLHLWSQVYEIRLAELFSTQDQIVEAVLRAMGQPHKVARRKRENLDLYQEYLKARALGPTRAAGANQEARRILERIVAADPDFAAAQAQLAMNLFNQGLDGPLGPAETAAGVRRHATAALRVDPENAEARSVLCRMIFAAEWDWAAAERECREAIRLSPGAARGYVNLGVVLSMQGRAEGVAALEHAVKLDPLYRLAPTLLAQALYFTRRFEESIRVASRAVQMYPQDAPQYTFLALSHLALKNYPAALEAATRCAATNQQGDSIAPLGLVGSIHAAAGHHQAAYDLLRQIEAAGRKQHVAPMISARVYASLGEADKMFEHLERGYAEHDLLMPWLAVDARFDPYRRDPRFRDLLRRMKLG